MRKSVTIADAKTAGRPSQKAAAQTKRRSPTVVVLVGTRAYSRTCISHSESSDRVRRTAVDDQVDHDKTKGDDQTAACTTA